MRFEKTASTDLPAVTELLCASYDMDRERIESDLRDIVESPGVYGHIYGLWVDDALVGTVTFGPFFKEGWLGEGLICYLAVSPDHRRKGYGRFMIERAFSLMDADGVPCAVVIVGKLNTVARAFWENFDFRIYAPDWESGGEIYDCYVKWFDERSNVEVQ